MNREELLEKSLALAHSEIERLKAVNAMLSDLLGQPKKSQDVEMYTETFDEYQRARDAAPLAKTRVIVPRSEVKKSFDALADFEKCRPSGKNRPLDWRESKLEEKL
jgi:hypothetical protein